MNKYTEMSDLEINKRVFVAAKIEHEDTDLHSNKVFYGDGANWIEFNPCNNPSDAFPLIIDVKLSIHPDFYNDCESWVVRTVHIPPVKDESLTRAICIAYLLMKDAENEKV